MSSTTGFTIGKYEVLESVASYGSYMVFKARPTDEVSADQVRDAEVLLELYNPISESSEAYAEFPKVREALLGTT